VTLVATMLASPVVAQQYYSNAGVSMSVGASTNPNLLPRGEEQGEIGLNLSPYFNFNGTAPGGRLRYNGSGNLSGQVQWNQGEGSSTYFRPQASLNGSLEAVNNFFFVDARALVYSQLDNAFLATPGPYSPTNTSTSYQLGVTPNFRGTAFSQYDYEVRSDNSWTNFTGTSPQYSANNSFNIQKSPNPWGGVFNFTQTIVSSDIEGQPNLISYVSRLSLRYAISSSLAVGFRTGLEKYNYTVADRSWQRYYGAEIGWQPSERTSLEGYYEDRVFGNSWNVAFSHRRPLSAFTFNSSRLLTSTPQQFLSVPGLANVQSLLDASLTTRIPDPIERQRAVDELIRQRQIPQDLLAPIIINSEGVQVTESNSATLFLYTRKDSLAFNLFWTSTLSSSGISTIAPVSSKTLQRGASANYGRQLNPTTSFNTTATWRNTQNQFDVGQETTQTQIYLSLNWNLSKRTAGTLGTRYQWITSTYTNDAVEAAIFATLSYSFR
jgi:uncharacterized protein (PEP-CTERM system associated)